jgi:hypothetical protein
MKPAKTTAELPRRMVWLPGRIHRRAKIAAARRSTTLAKLIEEALSAHLTRDEAR